MIESELSEAAQPAQKRAPKMRRRWRIVAMVGAAPAMVFGVIYMVACWRAQQRLDQEIERIATRGEPVWFSDLAARADDPALARGRAVIALLQTIQTLPRRPEPGSVEGLSAQEQADARAAVEHNRPKCRELARLARLGDCRFENDYQATVPGEAAVPAVGNLDHVHQSCCKPCWAEQRSASPRARRSTSN